MSSDTHLASSPFPPKMDNEENKLTIPPVDDGMPAGPSVQSPPTPAASQDLAQFVSDIPRLTQEIFDSVGWEKIKTMLPPYMKDCTREQIYNLVSNQLNGMTQSRILDIMGAPGGGPSRVPRAGPSGVAGAGPSGVAGAGPSGVPGAGPSGVPGAGPSGVPGAGPSGVLGAGPSGSGPSGGAGACPSEGAQEEGQTR